MAVWEYAKLETASLAHVDDFLLLRRVLPKVASTIPGCHWSGCASTWGMTSR